MFSSIDRICIQTEPRVVVELLPMVGVNRAKHGPGDNSGLHSSRKEVAIYTLKNFLYLKGLLFFECDPTVKALPAGICCTHGRN